MTAAVVAPPIHVLLVEDNPGDARLIREMLREGSDHHFDLAQVDRLDSALQLLRSAETDVILLDLGLPDSQGLATFEQTQREAGGKPIVVISGLDDEEVALAAVRAGAQDYLVKGRIEGHMLARVIRYAIERQRTTTQLSWLTLAVDQSPASVFITDPRGTIQYVNERFTEITGYSRAEAIGQTPRILKSGLTPPAYYQALWKALQNGETWRSEIQNRRKNGELYWDAVTVSPIRDQRGAITHFLAVQEDVTERKGAERTLRERDEQFHQLADNIKEVFFLQDAHHQETLYINKAYEEIWGRSAQSLYERPESFVEAILEEDRPALFASIERNRAGEYAGDVEFRVRRPEGDVRWVLAHAVPVRNAAGEVYRLAGVVTDITERRRAEERAQSLFENSPMPMWVFDRETLRILAVNNAAIAKYGHSREEFLALTIDDLRPAEEVARLHAFLSDHGEEGYRQAGIWRHRRKDGSELLVELSAHDLTFADRPARLVTIYDVTTRARSERLQAATYRIAGAAHQVADLTGLLRSVHETVATLMPAKSFYIALYDERSDLITFPYFVDEHDPPPPSRHPGSGITDYVLRTGEPLLVDPATTLEWEQSVGTPSHYWLGVPLKTGDRTTGVLAVQTYTPGVRYSEGDKEMLQFVSTQIATAIERKRADEALRTSEERFRALVERSGDAIALLDRTGVISYASPSTARVLGREPNAVVGTNAFDVLHVDDVAEVRRTLGNLRRHPGLVLPVRSRFLHGDGTWHEGEGTVTNRLDDPAVRAVVFNYRDVTEQRHLETQLRQAQKMEAIGRLAGGVAHDFNNLLTAIFGYVDLLREELPQDSSAQQDLAEVRKASERAAMLTKQLLAFSRQQVLEPVVLEINELVEDFEKMLRRVIGEDVEMRLTLGPDVGNVRADPGQLQQVIMNLVVNARDAMPTGGKLILETANADLTEQYAELHQPVVPGRYILLAVSDTGMGMTPQTKARIFEPFFTTKEKGKGTGLGLSTVYGIVKQSGGYVWVYTELGRGTTFKIYLPRVEAPAEEPMRPRQLGSVAGTETILLAEDDAILRPLANALLTKLGYRVLEGEDANSALAAAQAHQGPIHLLVADVVMPGPSGRELARRLAETRPETRVLYVSGYTDDAIVHHGMLEPGLNFLQKPFTPAVLARKVRDVLDAK